MRSRSEQRIWDDIERFHAAEAAEPVLPGPHPARRRDGRGVDDPPVAVVAGTWSAIPLILFGAVVAGPAIGAATALDWLLWRWQPVAAWPGHHLGSAGEPLVVRRHGGHLQPRRSGAAARGGRPARPSAPLVIVAVPRAALLYALL